MTAIKTVKEDIRLKEWSEQVAAQQASGISVQKWCDENGINPPIDPPIYDSVRSVTIRNRVLFCLALCLSMPNTINVTRFTSKPVVTINTVVLLNPIYSSLFCFYLAHSSNYQPKILYHSLHNKIFIPLHINHRSINTIFSQFFVCICYSTNFKQISAFECYKIRFIFIQQ